MQLNLIFKGFQDTSRMNPWKLSEDDNQNEVQMHGNDGGSGFEQGVERVNNNEANDIDDELDNWME